MDQADQAFIIVAASATTDQVLVYIHSTWMVRLCVARTAIYHVNFKTTGVSTYLLA
jgi:hypothetical protein